jgi:flagellar hook-associated protein 2
MSGINFLGSYSGIDQSTIDKLMQIEKLPLNQLNNKKTDITAQQNAWKDVNTRLNSLYDKLKALQNSETFDSMTSKSSNENIVTMSASKDAVAGTYKIQVGQLATNTSYISGKIDAAYDEGNLKIDKALEITGRFTIRNSDGVGYTVYVNSGDSLKSIVENINSRTNDTTTPDGEKVEGTGISATIINGSIVLADEKTGKRNITLTGDETQTLSKLGLNKDARVELVGDDALFSVNGVDIKNNSNTVTDAVLGLTIDLKEVGSSTITVATDTEKLTKAVQDFVDQYNSTMSFIEEQLAVGTVTEEGTTGRGTLAGDSSLRSLQSSLRRMVTDSLGADKNVTSIKDISQLGVTTTDRTGKLSFDSSKLLEEFNKDPNNVINFFGNAGLTVK